MGKDIHYSIEPPGNFQDLVDLYEELGWNTLHLSKDELQQMCSGSWYSVYAYDNQQVVGMGRVISDGVITGVLCGICALPGYQSMGIGKEIVKRLTQHCVEHRVIPQLMCSDSLIPYYESLGFKKFTAGMMIRIDR
ncbi:GNAT family N-acetyltransferase [Paenibacillus arenosi]|uniref:GNAT family N-acetyltransferase n=1 Tax=Paenibacillus arenosi TaxID=2774142 RepID=A0ABR9B4H4_9BACL|nr:GNAT family N-acetyltransferase [Paenibacillus arenosi]MBD8501209.1 GNAT family N-acetyltransferase [Paenibacillus arenosi]